MVATVAANGERIAKAQTELEGVAVREVEAQASLQKARIELETAREQSRVAENGNKVVKALMVRSAPAALAQQTLFCDIDHT